VCRLSDGDRFLSAVAITSTSRSSDEDVASTSLTKIF
jgi:hypothetical protein